LAAEAACLLQNPVRLESSKGQPGWLTGKTFTLSRTGLEGKKWDADSRRWMQIFQSLSAEICVHRRPTEICQSIKVIDQKGERGRNALTTVRGQESRQDERAGGRHRLWQALVLSSRRRRRQAGTAAINLILYAVLVVAYFFVVLQWLNEPLARLFQENLTRYAIASVMLILGQGLLLDIVTAKLLRLARWLSGRRRE
jgi:hypothetical protein